MMPADPVTHDSVALKNISLLAFMYYNILIKMNDSLDWDILIVEITPTYDWGKIIKHPIKIHILVNP